MFSTDGAFTRSDGEGPSSLGAQKNMPIAIIGMSCKFPGDATSPEALWKLCEEGRSAWSEIPRERFNKDAFYHPSGDRTTTTNVTGGHFLKEDIGLFDATFFNMTPEVSATMDPQCRLQLESVYEALENSGTPLEDVAGSRTAVFSGAFYKDYMDSLMRDPEELPRYVMTGNGATMMANRISHFYDLRGPSMTVDTGCSTGLVALHQACQSLKTSDAKMAVVVGANIMINPDIFVLWSSLGFLSPDGKCYAFDSRASGYGRGEGVATLILKPLSEAVRDGDPIRAVIAQTALNQDGKTQTITSPSQSAQEELMRMCYASAGLNPRETAYVEAHGTGTKAGDPTEAGAIHNVFCKEQHRTQPLYMGSVKTNIGHLETASGFAAIIKVALALEKGLIPPSINFENGNEKIPFEEWNLKIPRRLEPWPEESPRRASLNNFGYGGANAHVIMEAWQPYLASTMNALKISASLKPPSISYNGSTASSSVGNVEGCFDKDEIYIDTPVSSSSVSSNLGDTANLESRVLLLSAKDEAVVREMVSRLKVYVENSTMDNDELINRLTHTLGHRRSKFPWRLASPFPTTKPGLISTLDELAHLTPARSTKVPRLGFVFTGQGAQWYAMARELIDVYPVFLATLHEADRHLRAMDCSWSLIDELTKNEHESNINDVVLSPPLCIAVQIGLVRLLESWNIRPTAITSHSSGEIASAYAAGLLDLREAMAIVFARGAFLQSLQANAHYRGAMIVAGIGREEAQDLIDRVGTTGSAVVACVNSPSSVTISGDQQAISQLEEKLNEDKIFVRALKVPVAYHSHHMNPVAADYLAALEKVLSKERTFKDVHYTSPVTGGTVTDSSVIGPKHWVENMLQPVLFVDSLSAMCLSSSESGEQLIDSIVEVGPHAALAGPIRQTLKLPHLKGLGITYDSCLWRGKNAVNTMHALVASLVAKGYPVDLDAVNFPTQTRTVKALGDLPSYPWNHRTRYWYESRVNKAHRNKKLPSHDLLGARALGSNPTNATWRHFIRTSEVPWVVDHKVQSDIVYPGAGLVCMALEAMRQLDSEAGKLAQGFKLRDVEILQALVIPEGERGIEVHLTFYDSDGKTLGLQGWKRFSISSVQNDGSWREHCRGFINTETKQIDSQVTFHDSQSDTLAAEDPDSIFAFFRSVGIFHGDSFRNLRSIKAGSGSSVTCLEVSDTAARMPAHFQQEHLIHPTTLDSIIVAAYSSLPGCGTRQKTGMVPRHIKNMYISNSIERSPGSILEAHSSLIHVDEQGFRASVAVQKSSTSNAAIVIEDLHCISIGTVSADGAEPPNKCLTIDWAEDLSLNSMSKLAERLKTTPDARESAIVRDLHQACFYFFHDAVNSLSHSDIENLEWYHRFYYNWMKLQISKQPMAAEWLKLSAEKRTALLQHVAETSTSGDLVCRIGQNLQGILQRQIAPLELMLKDQLLYRYYQEALHIGSSYRQVHQIVDLFAHKNPHSKILEIGGGTGGCTTHVLRALGGGDTEKETRFSHYDFTDVSVHFFDEAKSRFSSWGDQVNYRKLDIETSPVDQGFENGTYDLIVACQVLHATTDIDKTMTHVRHLLKPGGKLLLVETTQDSHDIQLIFGVLPGWWLSKEPERKQSPNLSPDLWSTVLSRNGFNGVDLRARDCEDDEKYVIDVMLASASKEVAKPTDRQVSIICAQLEQIDRAWLDELAHDIREQTDFEPVFTDVFGVTPSGRFSIFLDNVQDSVLLSPAGSDFQYIKQLVTQTEGLLWISYGAAIDCPNPSSALHSGFLRTLRCEDASKRYVSLDLELCDGNPFTRAASTAIAKVLGSSFDFNQPTNSVDLEYALRRNSILIPRLYEDREKSEALAVHDQTPSTELQPFNQPGRECRMIAQVPGMLDSLTFVDDPDAQKELPDGYIEIEPRAFGLNFRDVMVAMGQLKTKVMGFECSGVVTKIGPNVPSEARLNIEDRVCALLRGHWATHTRVHWTSVAKLPETMSFEVAASIPIVYITAYYALYQLANIQEGETVLIHSAAGGVGQAAIQFAQLAGAKIFATVGSKEKEDLIVEQYGIPREHIFSSRDKSFAQHIRSLTTDGVDVILNSLAGDLLHETWNCIAPFGRFVEIGKRDFEQNNSLQMAPFVRAASFFAVDLFQLGALKPAATARAFQAVMKFFENDRLKPLAPISNFPISQIEKAFRIMQAGKHLGKIVIVPHSDDLVKKNVSRVRLLPNATYVVVGGVGGIGKSVVHRLVDLGAKNIALLSRNAESSQHKPFLAELTAADVSVKAKNVDISDAIALQTAAQDLEQVLPPIKGVIQAAMVLQDSIVENMTHEDYVTAVRPKVQGTWNLHHQFQNLDFFIMLSSLVGMSGNSSQSNYAAGGSFQDALARHRSVNGLPAVCLDLGMIGGVGYVARTAGVKERLSRQGYQLVSDDEVLSLIEAAIASPRRQPQHSQVLVGVTSDLGAVTRDDSPFLADIRFSCLKQKSGTSANGGVKQGGHSLKDLGSILSNAASWEDSVAGICQAIIGKLSAMFGLPEDEIDPAASMSHYGVDSLVAVELRNWLSSASQSDVSIFDIMQSKSLTALAEVACGKSKLVPGGVKPAL